MKNKLLLKVLMVALFVMLGTETTKAVTYGYLPNWPGYRGFYYCLDMADYPTLLLSNMPYKVLQGYIIADSALRTMPSVTYLDDPIEKLNILSDTAEYIYKYWYYMNEYDPLRFYAFLHRKCPECKNNANILHSDLQGRVYIYPKTLYSMISYILHVYVNNTVHIDTTSIDTLQSYTPVITGTDTTYIIDTVVEGSGKSEVIAFCRVLDTLKGGAFPSLTNAIFNNGSMGDNISATASSTYSIPNQTDIVFSYIEQWSKGENTDYRWPQDYIFDANGGPWVKPGREYIVFLGFLGIDAVGSWDPVGSVHKQYYCIIPYHGVGSYNMYPVENGNVIDVENALGFGTSVPIEVFKQNIRNKINEIKNYGE